MPPQSLNRQDGAAVSTETTSADETRAFYGQSPARFWILSVGVCLGLFLSIIDSSIVATSMFTIGMDFHNLQSVNWVALAYTLAYLGCAVAFAHISDVIGRYNAFLLAFALFFVFSLASGFAQNLQQLVAFRVLQGVGGSGLYSLAMIILPEMCPQHLLKFVGSLIGMVVATSGILGPILGGVLTQYAKWRWIFWINGPIGAISAFIFLLSWPSKKHYNPAQRLKWKNFDYFGTFLIIAASVLVVFAFQNSGESFFDAWGGAIFIAPLAIGLICWIGVFIWSFMVDSGKFGRSLAPALPLRLFRNRHYCSAALTTLLIGFTYFHIVFTFPTRAQVVSKKSVIVSGLELLPMIGSSAVGSMLTGFINGKKNYLAETITAGCLFNLFGCGLLSTVHSEADDAKALGFLVFAGLGFGLSTAAATMLVTFEAPIADTAPAHGILAQMRILGGSIGISVASILLRNEITRSIHDLSPRHPRAISGGGDDFNLDPGLQFVSTDAYSDAFRTGMAVCSIVAGVAVLISVLGFRKSRLDMNEQRTKLQLEDEILLTNQGKPNTVRHQNE